MSRNNEDNQPRKNHYADFDEHGHMRNESRNRDSRSDERSRESHRFGSHDQRYGDRKNSIHEGSRGPGDYNHPTFGTRAYGDMSGGTPYGEGGSTYGSGSAYGRSNYGFSGEYGPHNQRSDRNRSENVRSGYGDYTDYDSRNYGSYGGGNYRGSMERDRDSGNRGYADSGYGDTGRENTGYDRGFGSYGRTGYGSTGYDNRDMDRERSISGNRGYGNPDRVRGLDHGREHNPSRWGNQNSYNRSSNDRDLEWEGY